MRYALVFVEKSEKEICYMLEGIRSINIQKDQEGKYKHVRIVFGPHHFVDLTDEEGKLTFILGATHHGFRADASEVNGELFQIIKEIRRSHPDKVID